MGANFTPSWNSYADVKPFRFWCQKVLPTVYDDSLSYYELLCKVVAILNQVIDDMDKVEQNTDALLGAYEQLQEYVNTYFDNLDLTEIVDAELDKMAENGTLENLVKPYFDEWIEAAEAWATGEINGQPVGIDDPQYHNNAKYYNDRALDFSYESEAWARGTVDGVPVTEVAVQYENNSKYYAEQAAQSAQSASQSAADATYANEAQAWATGEVNGTPVTSDKPQYENNAEYYANQAASSASSAGSAASAAVADAYDAGVANVYYFSVRNIKVLATRNVIAPSGQVSGVLNIPGLIAIRVPAPRYNAGDSSVVAYTNTELGILYRKHGLYPIGAWCSPLRENRYIVQPVYDGYSCGVMVDGEGYSVLFFTVYDYVAGQFVADNTVLDQIEFVMCSSQANQSGVAFNDTNVGEQMWT